MNTETNSALLLLSGGLDSTTLLYWLTRESGIARVDAVAFNYGQRHNREIAAARTVAGLVGVPLTVIDLRALGVVIGDASVLTGSRPVPHGHYQDETMRETVVPGRNMMFLSVAFMLAAARGLDAVAIAVHQGDHAIYPDCRPAFVSMMRHAFAHAHYSPPGLIAPFLMYTKVDIVRLARKLDVPTDATWTCYEGGERPCGLCGACVERREAFEAMDKGEPR